VPKEAGNVKLSAADLSLAAVALIAGAAIAWVDTRPTWDDTGITAGALVLVAGLTSFAGMRPWLAAALVAGPLIVAEWRVVDAGLLIPSALTLTGACAGMFARRGIARPSRTVQ
jgi:hypothetical protein